MPSIVAGDTPCLTSMSQDLSGLVLTLTLNNLPFFRVPYYDFIIEVLKKVGFFRVQVGFRDKALKLRVSGALEVLSLLCRVCTRTTRPKSNRSGFRV